MLRSNPRPEWGNFRGERNILMFCSLRREDVWLLLSEQIGKLAMERLGQMIPLFQSEVGGQAVFFNIF